MSKKNEKKKLFRLDIAIFIGILILLISLGTYMSETTLEEVLENEYGSPIVTHDYSSSEKS